MRDKELDMLHAPYAGTILRYTFPLIVSGFLQLAFNTADTIVVGRFAGDGALAAVGSTTSLIQLILNVFLGLGVGVSVCVSHGQGAGDREAVSRTVHTAALTALLGGTALLFVGFFGCPLFLSWMDTPEDVIDLAVRYMRIYFLSVPAMFVFNFCAAALRASGDTRHPTRYLVIAGAVNVVLNLLTAAVFRLGVTGVAAATTVSQYLSAVLLVSFLRRRGDACRLEWGKLRIDGGKLRRSCASGSPPDCSPRRSQSRTCSSSPRSIPSARSRWKRTRSRTISTAF